MTVKQYPVQTLLTPRTFVFSATSNSEALILQSPTQESRIRFVNSYLSSNSTSPSFVIASSNQTFYVATDSLTLATFQTNLANNTPIFSVPNGTVNASIFQIPSTNTSAKSFVLRDYNALSTNQYAGLGYTAGRIQYQGAFVTDVHAFQVGQNSLSSAELMRIQSTLTGSPQIGIGTTTFSSSNVALAVAGSTTITGDLTVSGSLNFDRTGIVQLNPTTQRLDPTIMPQKLLYLNSNNQVDPTYFPQGFNFQFLKAQKNVGIGTRYPIQRLHVNGSTYISERLGIGTGTGTPLATIHAIENLATIATIRLENNCGGNVLEAYTAGSNIFTVGPSQTGIGAGIGIGTTIIATGNVLQMLGNGRIDGSITISSNMTVLHTLTANKFVLQDTQSQSVLLTQQNLVQYDGTTQNTVVAAIPFSFNTSIATPIITGVGPNPYVYVKNTGLRVDGDFILGSQMYAVSDARVKTNIELINDPLVRLEHIRGYTYNRIHATASKKHAGVLAQEVLEALPEAVTHLPGEHYAVSYDSLVPLLIEAVHALKREIADLKSAMTK